MKTRLTIWLCLPVLVLLIYMIWGIWKVSIKEGEKWKKLANSQQLKSTVVTASRGTIYDAKGNVLAQSATVYRIFVDPVMLKQQCDKRDARITELTAAIKEEDDDVTLARYKAELAEAKTGEETFNELVEKVKDLNKKIASDKSLGKGFCIGHSYFCGHDTCTEEWLHSIVDFDILPMLSEYWFDDSAELQRWENILHGVFQ